MTDQQTTVTLSEGDAFVARFRALISEAETAGYRLTFDVVRDPWESYEIEQVDLDLHKVNGPHIDTVFSEDWS